MTEAFCDRRDLGQIHAKVQDDWVIVTIFSRPEPYRLGRAITVFRRDGVIWRRGEDMTIPPTLLSRADEVIE